MLREQLIKSGWRDSLKKECRRVVQEQGLDNISVDEIIKQVTPHARCKLLWGSLHTFSKWKRINFLFNFQLQFQMMWNRTYCTESKTSFNKNQTQCENTNSSLAANKLELHFLLIAIVFKLKYTEFFITQTCSCEYLTFVIYNQVIGLRIHFADFTIEVWNKHLKLTGYFCKLGLYVNNHR